MQILIRYQKVKKRPNGRLIFVADGEGFEPPKVLFHTLSDFKSDAFNRSANHPEHLMQPHHRRNIKAFFFKTQP